MAAKAVKALLPPTPFVREATDPQAQRRRARFALRDTLAQIATNQRHVSCGRYPFGDGRVQVRRNFRDNGKAVAHFAKLQLCGCVWTCPVCGPRVRQVRADDINTALHRWYDDHGKGSVLFLTLTLPHDFGEDLTAVLGSTRRAFSQLVAGRAWQQDKAKYGLEHYIRAHDVTVGANGWHPHLHILLLARKGCTPAELEALRRRLFTRWCKAVGTLERRLPTWEHGLRLEHATSPKDLAFYLSQVVTDSERLARPDLELARGDLKSSAHRGQRTPWQVLADYGARPNPGDLALWREWEKATRGVHSIRWSKGLRAAVGLGAELTDEQITMMEIGGELVWTFTPDAWRQLRYRRGVQADILEAAEAGGTLGVARYLKHVDQRNTLDNYEAAAYRAAALRAVQDPGAMTAGYPEPERVLPFPMVIASEPAPAPLGVGGRTHLLKLIAQATDGKKYRTPGAVPAGRSEPALHQS